MPSWFQAITLVALRMAGLFIALACAVPSAQSDTLNWYAGVALGGDWASGANQCGWNRDSIWYPTVDCFDQ